MGYLRTLFLLILVLLAPLAATGQDSETGEERIFILKDYQYQPGSADHDVALGMSLCGTRCSALSVDYLNYSTPGGWRLDLRERNRERKVNLDNPFLEGDCICVGDEFHLKVNDLYMSTIPGKK